MSLFASLFGSISQQTASLNFAISVFFFYISDNTNQKTQNYPFYVIKSDALAITGKSFSTCGFLVLMHNLHKKIIL